MENETRLDGVYRPSEDVVAREIAGEIVIVPLVSGIGDAEDELFSLSPTARAIWDRLDGRRTLTEVISDLAVFFEAGPGEIEADVQGLVTELLARRILVEASAGR